MATSIILASNGRPGRTEWLNEAVASVHPVCNLHKSFCHLPTAWEHYAKAVENVTDSWMTWLADDDRCVGRISEVSEPSFVAVCCYAKQTDGALLGPDVGDKTWGIYRPSDSVPLAPLSSWFVPPAGILRTELVKSGLAHLRTDCALYNERILFAHVAAHGDTIVRPGVHAIYRLHPGQESRKFDADEAERQWCVMFDVIADIMDSHLIEITDETRGRIQKTPLPVSLGRLKACRGSVLRTAYLEGR